MTGVDPYSAAISAVLGMAGGTIMGIGNRRQGQAQEKALFDQYSAQNLLGRRAYKTWKNSLLGFMPQQAEADIESGAQQRMADYNDVASRNIGGVPGLSAVGQSLASALNPASARLGGYSNWDLQTRIRQQNLANALRKILFKSQGSANVFPFTFQGAQHSQDWLKGLGAIISSLGNMSGSMGGMGGGGMMGMGGGVGLG